MPESAPIFFLLLLGGLALIIMVASKSGKPPARKTSKRRSTAPQKVVAERRVADVDVIVAAPAIARITNVPQKTAEPEPSGKDETAGLVALRGCAVSSTPVMSREQAAVYRSLRTFAFEQDLNLLAEVSLSAIFAVKDPSDKRRAYAGFGSIRQKRVDILLTNRDHKPICGIEYHGSGHWKGNAKHRDLVKRTAFEMAKLPLVTVHRGDDLSLLAQKIRAAIATPPMMKSA